MIVERDMCKLTIMKSDEIVRLIIRGILVDWCEKYFVSLIIDIRNFGKIFIYVTMCIEI